MNSNSDLTGLSFNFLDIREWCHYVRSANARNLLFFHTISTWMFRIHYLSEDYNIWQNGGQSYWIIYTGLTLRRTSFSGVPHYGVFCTRTLLPKGSRFGPFQGKVVNTSEIKTNDDNTYMWEVSVILCIQIIIWEPRHQLCDLLSNI